MQILRCKLNARLGKGGFEMLKRIVVLIIGAFIWGSTTAAVTITADRFTGEKTVWLKPDKLHMDGTIDFFVFLTLSKAKPTPTAVMDLASVHQSWKYLECHSVHWLVDDQPVSTPPARHDGSVNDGYVIEHVTQEVPLSVLQQFASAKKVEYEICNDQGKLDADTLRELNDFINQVKTARATP